MLRCQPAETETALVFGALGDLLEPVLDQVLPILARPQRLALETALALVEPEEPLARLALARSVLSDPARAGRATATRRGDRRRAKARSATTSALEFAARRAGDTDPLPDHAPERRRRGALRLGWHADLQMTTCE